MNYYLSAFKKYAVFDGRSRRTEYFMFSVFNFVVLFILYIADWYLKIYIIQRNSTLLPLYQIIEPQSTYFQKYGVGLISFIYSIISFFPKLSILVRRLHDTNRRGWWMLIQLIPIVGLIVMCVFIFQDSDANENRFGLNPKSIAESYS